MKSRRAVGVTLALLVAVVATAAATVWFTGHRDAAARVEGYGLSTDARLPYHDLQVTVLFTLGIGDTVTYARFEERGDRVIVTVRYRSSPGPRTDLGKPYQLTATLDAPLGTRTVVDGSSGQTVPRLPG
jgi:hypothetical protein